ncbi:sulfatase [candidate division KSB1 bacterium]|nr:sulfatase [candidate division KSB1 bacterium]
MSAHTSCGSRRKQPNILFIFTDDHAYQAISAYGSNRNKTPHIDRLANEGVLFTNCCVTNSICAPSRAVIQTGKYSHLNGVYDNLQEFNTAQQTFPKLLKTAGYETALIGKWHLKADPDYFDHWQVLPGQGHYYNPDFRTVNGSIREEGYVTEIITDKALDWLQSRDAQKPFLLMLQHKAPHREWSPNLKDINMYDDIDMPEPATLFDDYSGRGSAARMQEMEIDRHMTLNTDLKVWESDPNAQEAQFRNRLTPAQLEKWQAGYADENLAFRAANPQGKDLVRWKYQRYVKDYLRCIHSVDENIGRVLDYLDDSGLAKNTVVIYSSDQGFYLGEHGWFDKRWMYEESFKTPLIVRWPGVTKPGTKNDALVSNLDFAETFLDIAGVPIPADMQGHSLAPLLQGKKPANWRTSVYYHYYEYPAVHMVNKHEGVYDGRYKLMHFYELDEWELYDLQNDPQELRSVHDDPAYAAEVQRLTAEMARLKTQYQVPEERTYEYGK